MTGIAGSHTGGCLCGAVRFRTEGPLRAVIACHCGQCRRQSGLYYAATDVDDTCLTIDDQAGMLCWYHSSNQAARGFCKRCGSALFWRARKRERTSILAGAFDPPTGLQMAAHIYCADKGDFYTIADGLPQHARDLPAEHSDETE
ncbi:GFA family protein [Pseudohoeflea coraliihabitans]|uniref:GFA family protein n=1 Tax=Pseudohoeflea coraliihabitans TaxID=2860393 RepID=A0ABS6WPZ1_9HYPH|nr:GFA family protein [Pseudohoeflea sp. DP4N28-3]MBW3098046.1 GFA family protein [Pseudohoeflea sp. DP4N28-3]